MEIYDGGHVSPVALHVLELNYQLIYPLLRIPVYVINALYLWPITVWTYFKYGRTVVPRHGENAPSHCAHSPSHASAGGKTERAHSTHPAKIDHINRDSDEGGVEPEKSEPYGNKASEVYDKGPHNEGGHSHGSGERPLFATITVAVCHCGAGCVLGDIVGEWLIYGTGAAIDGQMLWVEYLIGTGLLSFILPYFVASRD